MLVVSTNVIKYWLYSSEKTASTRFLSFLRRFLLAKNDSGVVCVFVNNVSGVVCAPDPFGRIVCDQLCQCQKDHFYVSTGLCRGLKELYYTKFFCLHLARLNRDLPFMFLICLVTN